MSNTFEIKDVPVYVKENIVGTELLLIDLGNEYRSLSLTELKRFTSENKVDKVTGSSLVPDDEIAKIHSRKHSVTGPDDHEFPEGDHNNEFLRKDGTFAQPTGSDIDLSSPGPIGEVAPNIVRGFIKEIIKNETCNLTPAEVAGTVINNYGQTDNITLYLPTAAPGMSCMFICSTVLEENINWSIWESGVGYMGIIEKEPEDILTKYLKISTDTEDEIIYLDGIAGFPKEYVGNNSIYIGDSITFVTFQTGENKWDWIATSNQGLWEAAKVVRWSVWESGATYQKIYPDLSNF